eukprot:365053-Chlamydomonas_euryale.AAC.19
MQPASLSRQLPRCGPAAAAACRSLTGAAGRPVVLACARHHAGRSPAALCVDPRLRDVAAAAAAATAAGCPALPRRGALQVRRCCVHDGAVEARRRRGWRRDAERA